MNKNFRVLHKNGHVGWKRGQVVGECGLAVALVQSEGNLYQGTGSDSQGPLYSKMDKKKHSLENGDFMKNFTNITMRDVEKMTAVEILDRFTDHGEARFENTTVDQNYDTETTIITFPDFVVSVSGADVEIESKRM